MSKTLQKLFETCKLSHTGSLLITEKSSSSYGYSIIAHYLAKGFANGERICFISLHNTLGHYINTCSKFGFNLKQHCENENIKVIECLKLFDRALADEDKNNPFSFISSDGPPCLKKILKEIKNAVTSWKENGIKFKIIFDNLTDFLNIGVSLMEIKLFFSYCFNLILDEFGKPLNMIITLTNCGDNDSESDYLSKFINAKSITNIRIDYLETGFSREVNGNLSISSSTRISSSEIEKSTHHYQFKMEEKDMKIFSPGTALNVL